MGLLDFSNYILTRLYLAKVNIGMAFSRKKRDNPEKSQVVSCGVPEETDIELFLAIADLFAG